MAENHRRPLKYCIEKRNYWNWRRHKHKLLGKGDMKAARVELFEKLLAFCEEYKSVNQWE